LRRDPPLTPVNCGETVEPVAAAKVFAGTVAKNTGGDSTQTPSNLQGFTPVDAATAAQRSM